MPDCCAGQKNLPEHSAAGMPVLYQNEKTFMLEALVNWAVHNRLVVSLLTVALIAVGGYAFVHINVEAYPDPAPAIIEVIAQFPGASAEEVERQVTTPLEVALAGMPGLKSTRSKSLFGLAHLRNQFEYSTSYQDAKIEVLNRLSLAELPRGVQPQLAPTSPVGEIYRYYLENPVDEQGRPVYTLTDLKSLQDWTLQREFRRIPRIADVVSFGGAVKRYEVHPDPDRLRRFEISLSDLEDGISDSNLNAGGDYLLQPQSVQVVRGLGLIGNGVDPVNRILALNDPSEAAEILRSEEQRRLGELRQIVLAATNNVPIRVGDVVSGGKLEDSHQVSEQGVVVGKHTRLGRVSVSLPVKDQQGHDQIGPDGERKWNEISDTVQGIVLLRKGEQSLPALADVKEKVEKLNTEPGHLLPGVKVKVFDDRTNLIARTTDTVHENLVVGMVLVTLILLIFLNHLPTALIVAANIPLSLLFAFALLYLRGQSANLLSLGAVDFGIIVDSSVIMVECIFHRLSTGVDLALPLEKRILNAAGEVQRSLFYSTLIMVCALLPLFTMTGPQGQIFGPMADAYAFSLAGALLLALTVSPVLCRTFLGGLKHARENFFVRCLKAFYLAQLEWALKYRWGVIGLFVVMVIGTGISLKFLGREFMPALEEGNVYVRGTFPSAVSLDEASSQSEIARAKLQAYPEVRAVLAQVGRPDDGTDPTSFYNSEFFIPLKPEGEWPKTEAETGFWKFFSAKRHRTKEELVSAMQHDLDFAVVGVDWNFSQNIRDNVMETLSGVKGENAVKIFGPDLNELERIAGQVSGKLKMVRGVKSVGVFNILGQTNLDFSIDREKCARWNVNIADVQDVLATAVGGKQLTQMVEGERTFDITLRWPHELRADQEAILDIPVDVLKNRVIAPTETGVGAVPLAGTSISLPSVTGSSVGELSTSVPRRRLRDLVTPVNAAGELDPYGSFTRSGASTIYREQGQRLIAVKFSVRERDLAGTVADAQAAVAPLIKAPYRVEWAGEFEEMQSAIVQLASVAALAMGLIVVLLYLSLRSLLDVAVVLTNVLVIVIGGIWALLATGMTFNISAGVGFISVLGVGMMNGLILVSGLNARRLQGMNLHDAIRHCVEDRVRPLTMAPLTATFGMLPAALATKIGSQTQKPLAVVVVGGMLMTLLFLNLIPVLYSLYGRRDPPAIAAVEH